jgi:hypothetical protein
MNSKRATHGGRLWKLRRKAPVKMMNYESESGALSKVRSRFT